MKRDEKKQEKKKLNVKRDPIRTLTNDSLKDVAGGKSTTHCGQTNTCTGSHTMQ